MEIPTSINEEDTASASIGQGTLSRRGIRLRASIRNPRRRWNATRPKHSSGICCDSNWCLDYDEGVRRLAIVRICVLASSSAGNSIFIASATTRILIDAGLNRKEICARLQAIGEDALQLDGIFLTHEHSDHIAGLAVLMKTVKAPIFATAATASALEWSSVQPQVVEFAAGTGLQVGDLCIQSFSIPHDARDPVGYTVTCGTTKVSVATDLGYVPDNVRWNLRGSQFILLESNHCPEMLKVGPYPWHLKQRILSRRGHLSNEAASDYIATELPDETETLVLGHLSEQNNSIWQADLVARQALLTRGREPILVVAEPRKQSVLFQL